MEVVLKDLLNTPRAKQEHRWRALIHWALDCITEWRKKHGTNT